MDSLWPWVLVALLGAYHGLNPAMGWLFAVALGMQEGDRRAVLRALPPIAARPRGVDRARRGARARARRARRHRGAAHGRRDRARSRSASSASSSRARTSAGCKARVKRGELAWWSFLMSTAHGAGLMVAPVLIGAGAGTAAAAQDHAIAAAPGAGLSLPGSGVAVAAARRRDGRRDGSPGRAGLRPLGPQRAAQGVGQPRRACGPARSCSRA